MHSIEPYYNWRHLYIASEDERSPFYGVEYSEFEFTHAIYNHLIHPQWDDMNSPTLFLKILYCDYDQNFAIIELIGEWNDCINNDIMLLKRDIVDVLMAHNINQYIIIGENVLNFHPSDDCYYEEWFEDCEDGWIAFVNFQEHVLREFENINISYYVALGGHLNTLPWRTWHPEQVFQRVKELVQRRLT